MQVWGPKKTELFWVMFTPTLYLFHRKSTFDMFNFLASQHRQLPDTDLYDEEEDEVLLKSTRWNKSLNFTEALFLSYDAHKNSEKNMMAFHGEISVSFDY